MPQKILLALIMTFALNLLWGVRSSGSAQLATTTHLAEMPTIFSPR